MVYAHPASEECSPPKDDTWPSDYSTGSEENQSDIRDADASGEPTIESISERGSWGGKLEFLLACIGNAVGLGNIWRFPYLCFKNGGGAFLIPYVISLACIGLPLFYFEIAFGQFPSLGPLRIWVVSPICKGLGIGMVVSTLIMMLYYNVVIAWCFRYLFASMTTNFPWASCTNDWNDHKCITTDQLALLNTNETLLNQTLADRKLTSPNDFMTSAEQYYYSEMLQMSDGIDDPGLPVWEIVLCLLLVWTIVYLVLIKGISSYGKASYVFTLLPYILITIMLGFTCTLDGAIDGIIYYVKPDLSRLADAEVWADAATQIFFSLSTCGGGLIAMSSYNKFHNNCQRDALIIPIVNCLTSFYAGFAVFSVLGFIAHLKHADVADVVEAGPGLVFIAYPEALSQMPVPTFWSILFFIMFIFLGFGSSFGGTESVFIGVLDQFDFLRASRMRTIIFRGICCFCFFLAGLPMVTNGGFYIFTLFDQALSGFPFLVFGFLQLIAVNWIYGFPRFAEDIEMMIGKRPSIYYRVCWTILSPAILLAILVMKAIQFGPLDLGYCSYPDWSYAIYWAVVGVTLIWVPLVGFIVFCRMGAWQVLRNAAMATSEWEPALPEHRTGRYERPSPDRSDHKPHVPIGCVNDAYQMEEKSDRL